MCCFSLIPISRCMLACTRISTLQIFGNPFATVTATSKSKKQFETFLLLCTNCIKSIVYHFTYRTKSNRVDDKKTSTTSMLLSTENPTISCLISISTTWKINQLIFTHLITFSIASNLFMNTFQFFLIVIFSTNQIVIFLSLHMCLHICSFIHSSKFVIQIDAPIDFTRYVISKSSTKIYL